MRIFLSSIVTMVAAAFLILAAVLASGCKHFVASKVPVAAQCNAICYTPCVDEKGDTGIQWLGDYTDPKAWDALSEDVLEPLATKLRECEKRRKACNQCLDRLEEQKVIVQ